MPWMETVPMDERRKFVEACRSRAWTMTELCDRFSVSRKTGYKWLKRADTEGWPGVKDRSRKPKSCPWHTPTEIEDSIIAVRLAHPSWGPVKILEYLEKRRPELTLPAASTAGRLLDSRGLVSRRRTRRKWRHPSGPLLPPIAPNEVVTADFKGQFRTGDGLYCYPLTIANAYSRYLLSCKALLRAHRVRTPRL